MRNARRKHRRAPSKCSEAAMLGDYWFLPKKVHNSIRHLIPKNYRHGMGYFYQDYGCLRCGRRDREYGANGMCQSCAWWVVARVKKSLLKRKTIQELSIAFRENSPGNEIKERLHSFRRRKARELLAGLVSRRKVVQKGRHMLKSRSWRTETVEMPFGTVQIIS